MRCSPAFSFSEDDRNNDEARMTNDEGMTRMTKPEIAHEDDDSFWGDEERAVVREEPDTTRVYDLE
jgi:hypothetical protein